MKCTNPLHMEIGTVPCGKCMACRIARTKEWSIRMTHETFFHDKNIFVTLTYSEDNEPREISKEETRNFIKRLRKHLPSEQKIKYYICGEYGDKTDRPHYHAIIFGLGLEDHKIRKGEKNGFHILAGPLNKAWTKGYIFGGTVTPDSTRYVAGYIQKKLYGPPAQESGRTQPFATQSNGIGKRWYEKNEIQIRQNKAITFQGKSYQIPKYYIKKLELQDDLRAWNQIYHDQQESHYDNKYGRLGYTPAIHQHRIQTNKNLLAFQSLKENTL